MDERKFLFTGKNLGPETSERIAGEFEAIREKGGHRMEGEIEKSERFLHFIQLANKYLQEDVARVGLELPAVRPDQIHLFHNEVFARLAEERGLDGEDLAAWYEALQGAIYVNADIGSAIKVFLAVSHEMLHLLSFHKWHFDIVGDRAWKRVGYAIEHREKGEVALEKLDGLNEAMTEEINRNIMTRRKSELAALFGEPLPDEILFTYSPQRELLGLLITRTAKRLNEQEDEIWGAMLRGYFTGEIMHLRMLQRAFGPRTLDILSLLGADTSQETFDDMMSYFSGEDEVERDALRKKLLALKSRVSP